MTTNEPAERLRRQWAPLSRYEAELIDAALAAERRATVEDFAHTIRSHVAGGGWCNHPEDLLAKVAQHEAILDAERDR